MLEYQESEVDLLLEREELADGRIQEMLSEHILPEPYGAYFRKEASGILHPSYEAALPENYETSYLNPAYAVSLFGGEMGRLLSFLSYELLNMAAFQAENSYYRAKAGIGGPS
nr:hypothetical protein [Lachnospiraceae bacterium]